jgi:hypothetical protein
VNSCHSTDFSPEGNFSNPQKYFETGSYFCISSLALASAGAITRLPS